MSRRRPTFLGTTAVTFAILALTLSAFAVEPQTFVGDWEGTWNASRASGPLAMSVKKVEGNQATGTVYITGGAPYHNKDIPFTGAVDGNTLLLKDVPTMPGSPVLNWSFKINDNGTKMDGEGQGTVRATFDLTKKK